MPRQKSQCLGLAQFFPTHIIRNKKVSLKNLLKQKQEQLEVNELKLEGNPFVQPWFQCMLSRRPNQFMNRERRFLNAVPRSTCLEKHIGATKKCILEIIRSRFMKL